MLANTDYNLKAAPIAKWNSVLSLLIAYSLSGQCHLHICLLSFRICWNRSLCFSSLKCLSYFGWKESRFCVHGVKGTIVVHWKLARPLWLVEFLFVLFVCQRHTPNKKVKMRVIMMMMMSVWPFEVEARWHTFVILQAFFAPCTFFLWRGPSTSHICARCKWRWTTLMSDSIDFFFIFDIFHLDERATFLNISYFK